MGADIDVVNLFVGGGVETSMGVLLKLALEIINKGTLETSKDSFNSLAPLADHIVRCNHQLQHPIPGLDSLQAHVREYQKLVRETAPWWSKFPPFPYRQQRLQSPDEALQRSSSVKGQDQIQEAVVMEVLLKVQGILERAGKENLGDPIRVPGGAPVEPPEFKGMEENVIKLRAELLKDDDESHIVLLTGLGGSGKTTLAKKICWDPQIKGKFRGEFIFFVTASETFDVKNIVQKIFEFCGYPVSKIQSNSGDAINSLGVLLKHVNDDGKNPILLVLDDVWDNSEVLVEKFNFQIKGYKLLVTSRVAFRKLGTPVLLEPLGHDDSVSIFCQFAQLDREDSSSGLYRPDKKLVDEIVERCMGSPLALSVIGGSLCKKNVEDWKVMKEGLQVKSILESTGGSKLLSCLQQSLDMLEVKFNVSEKECFMDLGLFPEDQVIHVPTLIDMWAELHNLDDDSGRAMTIIRDLTTRNLVKLIVTRQVVKDEDMYYNNHFVVLHDLLRELANLQSSQEQFDRRKKLVIELNGDKRPEWWAAQNQQGIFGCILSLLPITWTQKKPIRLAAQILSISTDENFASDWCDMQPDEAEVLILNIHSSKFNLPQFIQKMSPLKVVTVTNHSFGCSELNNFELLGTMPDLKRIRLEKVLVPHLCILTNLRKLSLYMCNTKQAFESSSIRISDAMPKLVEMSIDYCKDLAKLPDGVCKIIPLMKLSITNCHKFSVLPKDIVNLKDLEVLRLSSCSGLEEMPESLNGLQKLKFLDISDCVSLAKLPEDIGELHMLEKLYMKGCSGLSELPYSVMEFEKSKHEIRVICDEESATLWENFPSFDKVKIETPKVDISLNWLHGVRS